ncbi:hypothetical protein DL765_000154 [Monosporascus sp. GIB2]|nr:hypothetical protein DL765_000154 [Monosporascus sp. GIB2]
MELLLILFLTHALAFVLGHNKSKQYAISTVTSLVIRLQQRSWTPQSSERSRIAKATRALEPIKVELLDRFHFCFGQQGEDVSMYLRHKGYKANEIDFFFLDSENVGDLDTAKFGAKAILEYHKILKHRGRNVSLVLICPPPTVERSVDEYHELFWSFLKRLRQLDPKPWPAHIPHDTFHQKWCMNFDETEAFFAVQSPAHRQRLSRYAPNLAMVYQPRYIFDIIFKDTHYRESATKTVRGLIDKYDKIPRSPDISDYGLDGTTESRQYFLLDKNEPAQCPYTSLDKAATEKASD